MSNLIRYAGHRYRQAEEPEAEQPAEDKEDQPKKDPCVSPAPPDSPYVKAATAAMSAASITGDVARLCEEADGSDVLVSVGSKWSGIEAALTFDYDKKGTLQELVLHMCGSSFVAHSGTFGGGKSLNMLLGAVGFLQAVKFSPGSPTLNVSKDKLQYIEFLQYYVLELLNGAVDLPYENRVQFAKALDALAAAGKYPEDVAKELIEGATKWLNDEDWKAEIVPLLQQQGKQHATTQELVNKTISALIPSDESYTGSAKVLGYDDDGAILAAIEVPKPIQAFIFVLNHVAGKKQLALKEAVLAFCGATFSVGADPAAAGQLVGTMIDLAILAGRTAQPELSEAPKPPGGGKKDTKKLKKLIEKGLVVYVTESGHRRMIWKNGDPQCYSDRQWETTQAGQDVEVSTYKNWLAQAEDDKLGVFSVRPDGTVDQLDYSGEPVRTGIGTISTEGQVCEVR